VTLRNLNQSGETLKNLSSYGLETKGSNKQYGVIALAVFVPSQIKGQI